MIGCASAALAWELDWPYLKTMADAATPVEARSVRWSQMAQLISTPQEGPAVLSPRRVAPAIAAGGACALLFGALGLWFHYGTAVFFEMIASGISACF